MSDHSTEPTPHQTSETLEFGVTERTPRTSSTRRTIGALAAAAVATAAVGAGFLAWRAWTAQGDQPAQALPGNTLAYLSLDLDPSGGQKVAAFRALRKIPSLKKELGLDSADDVSRTVVEGIAADGECRLDYARDVKPWIGDRAALAVVPDTRPEPVVVLQVTDASRARAGLKKVASCGGDFGYVTKGQWAVLAKNEKTAARVTKDAGSHPLSDDKEFRTLTGAAGDPGLVALYAAPEAGRALLDEIDRDPWLGLTATYALGAVSDPATSYLTSFGSLFMLAPTFAAGTAMSEDVGGSSSMTPAPRATEKKLMARLDHYDELSKAEQDQLMREQDEFYSQLYSSESATATSDDFPKPEIDANLRSSLQGFSGLGGVARFSGGRLEVEIVGDTIGGTTGDLYDGDAGDDLVADLPDDTAVAFGAGLREGWVDTLIRQFTEQAWSGGQNEKEATQAFEKATGLDVPGDVEALGGTSLAVSAGAGFDPEKIADAPEKAPIAIRISGDPERIEAALTKLRTKLGSDGAAFLNSRRAGEDVVVGPSTAYLEKVAGDGDLGGSDHFRDVVPDAKDATTVSYVNFDAGDWLTGLAADDNTQKDLAPLDALGVTVTQKKDHQQRILLRLGFDD